MYIFTNMYAHEHTHTRTHTLSLSLAHCLSVCIFVHTYKHTLKHTYARACARAHTHTQTNTLTKKFIFILSIEIFVLLYPIIIYSTNIWKVLYEISSLILGSVRDKDLKGALALVPTVQPPCTSLSQNQEPCNRPAAPNSRRLCSLHLLRAHDQLAQ